MTTKKAACRPSRKHSKPAVKKSKINPRKPSKPAAKKSKISIVRKKQSAPSSRKPKSKGWGVIPVVK